MPFKANAERRHHIPKQRHRVTNSAAYDAALRQRGSREFKLEAVRLVKECGVSVVQASWNLEVGEKSCSVGSRSSQPILGRPFRVRARSNPNSRKSIGCCVRSPSSRRLD